MNRLTPAIAAEKLASGDYVLGQLCRHGHEWGSTGQSLRKSDPKKKIGYCLECKQQYDKKKYGKLQTEEGLEQRRQQNALRQKAYRDRIKAEGGDRLEEFRRKNVETLNRWRVESNETYRESLRRYRSSEKGKLTDKRKHNKRRAAKKDNHSAPYSKRDLRSRLAEFDSKCAYCAKPVTTENTHSWDHFVPLCRGGCDALGNLVLACVECNSSKKHRDPETWYFSQPFATDRRWKALLKKLGIKEPGQLPLL